MGRINIDLAEATPNERHHDQRAPDQKRHCIDIVQWRSASGKEQHLAESVNPRSEHYAQANNEKFDSPLHCADG